MNERIENLWSQAGGHYNNGNQHTWAQYTIDNPEKFAELVIQEVSKNMEYCDGLDFAYAIWKTKKDFGFEE
jgi:hypothetical protein